MEHFATQHGKATNAGTVSSPWPIPFALAGANGAIQPGSTLHVDIDGVCPYELFPRDDKHGPFTPRNGFKVSLSGLPGNEITIKFTGHGIGSLPEYRGESGRNAWLPIASAEPGINLWEGTYSILNPRDEVFVGGYFLGSDNNTYPLTSSRYNDTCSITATSHLYNSYRSYYTGPTIVRQANTKPLIRLDHASAEAMLGKETIGPPSLNPNECKLHLFVSNGQFLDVFGSHLIIDGLNISFSYIGVRLQKTANHVTIRNGEIRGGVNLIACGEASNWLIDNMILDGLMDPEKGHLSWGDIKGGAELAVNNRTSCINPSTRLVDAQGTGGKVRRCILRNAFDGLTFGGKDMHIGDFAPLQPNMTIAEWDTECRKLGNWFDKIWDDSHQISHQQRNIIHNHNLYTGAGISRDGSAKSTDFGSGRPLSLCNIFDGSKHKLFWFRKGRDAVNKNQSEEGSEEGLRHFNTLIAHGGSKPDTNRPEDKVRPFPWIKVNDTEIWGDDCVRGDQAKGLHGAEGNLQNDEVNEEYNCIVIDRGVFSPKDNIHNRPWSGFWLDITTRKEIRDGNLIVNLAKKSYYHANLTTSAGKFSRIKTVKDMHTLAFADSKDYYLPGIDANSIEIGATSVADILDADYAPHHPNAVQGAVDIRNLIDISPRNIPGWGLYRPWRGAIPPKRIP